MGDQRLTILLSKAFLESQQCAYAGPEPLAIRLNASQMQDGVPCTIKLKATRDAGEREGQADKQDREAQCDAREAVHHAANASAHAKVDQYKLEVESLSAEKEEILRQLEHARDKIEMQEERIKDLEVDRDRLLSMSIRNASNTSEDIIHFFTKFFFDACASQAMTHICQQDPPQSPPSMKSQPAKMPSQAHVALGSENDIYSSGKGTVTVGGKATEAFDRGLELGGDLEATEFEKATKAVTQAGSKEDLKQEMLWTVDMLIKRMQFLETAADFDLKD